MVRAVQEPPGGCTKNSNSGLEQPVAEALKVTVAPGACGEATEGEREADAQGVEGGGGGGAWPCVNGTLCGVLTLPGESTGNAVTVRISPGASPVTLVDVPLPS